MLTQIETKKTELDDVNCSTITISKPSSYLERLIARNLEEKKIITEDSSTTLNVL